MSSYVPTEEIQGDVIRIASSDFCRSSLFSFFNAISRETKKHTEYTFTHISVNFSSILLFTEICLE